MSDKIRIGVLGAATIVPKALLDPAVHVDEVEVVAVGARDLDRATSFAAEHGIPRAYGSYEEILADPDIDVVYNPLPNGLHGIWTVATVAAGKHVLCEKPFTANAEEARWVASQVDGSGFVVMEAFHYRYHPIVARAIEIMRSGELGKLVSVEAAFNDFGMPPGDIRWNYELAGGALMDVGCYPVHLLRSIMAEEPTVDSAVAHEADPGVDADLDVQLSFSAGVRGIVRSSMHSTERNINARIVGEDATLDVENVFIPQLGNSLTVTSKSGVRREEATLETTYIYQLRALADAILRGAPILTDTKDSIGNMDVIDAAYTAAGLGPRPAQPH